MALDFKRAMRQRLKIGEKRNPTYNSRLARFAIKCQGRNAKV